MVCYKNVEIALKYNVSGPTVMKWIANSIENKNNLQLILKGQKYRILDNENNNAELARLSEEGKKFRKLTSFKKTSVSEKFYKLFSEDEIAEIMSDLELKRQMKTKYSYKVVEYWETFYKESQSPVTSVTDRLFENIDTTLDYYTEGFDLVNVVDLGPGNALPTKKIIQKYYSNNKLKNYVSLDISSKMNDLAVGNIKRWFPGVNTIAYEKDLEASRLGKILLEVKSMDRKVSNIIFQIGGTIDNHDDRVLVLKNIRNGMIDDDVLVFNFSIETDYQKANLKYVRQSVGDVMQYWPLELMGIDVDECEIIMEFDDKRKAKSKLVILDKDYSIKFNLFGQERTIELLAGEKINIWRHYLISIEQLLKELKQSELELAYLKLDKSLNYALAICKIKTELN